MNKKVKLALFASIILNIVLLSFQLGCGFGSRSPEERIQKKQEKIIAVLSDNKKQLAQETFKKLNEISNMNDISGNMRNESNAQIAQLLSQLSQSVGSRKDV